VVHTEQLSTIQPTPAARLFRGRRLGSRGRVRNRERDDEGLRCSLNGRLLYRNAKPARLPSPTPRGLDPNDTQSLGDVGAPRLRISCPQRPPCKYQHLNSRFPEWISSLEHPLNNRPRRCPSFGRLVERGSGGYRIRRRPLVSCVQVSKCEKPRLGAGFLQHYQQRRLTKSCARRHHRSFSIRTGAARERPEPEPPRRGR
jgi:hypothetical protein